MPTESRRKNTSLIRKLLESPQAYSFFQAVRLLEHAAQRDFKDPRLGQRITMWESIGAFSPPSRELLRLSTAQSFRFPEAEIHSVKRQPGEAEAPPWNMRVTFMGLTGSMGVMPFHYTELILQRLKLKDESLVHFLDLFNHRTLSLFYRAATKYRLPLQYERKRLSEPSGRGKNGQTDSHTQALLSLIGLGTPGLESRLEIRDESLLFYGGLLTQRVRTASGLRRMLQDYFEVPVDIRQFVGQWEELIPDARSRLSSRSMPKGQNAQLGKSLMFGRKGWFAQSKVRICLGPLNRDQFYRFAPGTKSLKALNEMARFYLGPEKDFEFVIEVKRKDVPSKIALRKAEKPIMGWNTWLSSTGAVHKSDGETFRITVSANRLQ